MSENKRYSNSEFSDFFRTKISGMAPESRMRYRKTLSELEVFLIGHHLRLADLSQAMVSDWAVEMLSRSLSPATVARHLNSFSGLLKNAAKEGMISPVDYPRTVSKSLSDSADALPALLDGKTFNACMAVLRDAVKRPGGFNIYEDIVLFSMLNGALPLEEVALLKMGSLPQCKPACQSIIDRNRDSRRAYLFDLRQSYLTPRKLRENLSEGVRDIFRKHAMSADFDADAFIRSLWVVAAIRNGLPASEAVAYVGGCAPYALPAFCTPAPDVAGGKDAWIDTVNSTLLRDMPRWYAMHLRRGVSFDELRMEIVDKCTPVPELFYPCETIVKRMGNRKVMEEHPFIASTAFFRTRPECVLPLFSIIGEMAWCYRTLGIPGAPYAVIPTRDMQRFQGAIGVFTPDVEVMPLGRISPKPGESVIVLKAGFGNRTGEVEEVINKGCGSAIFRVRLATDTGYEFRIDVDERQIERIIG